MGSFFFFYFLVVLFLSTQLRANINKATSSGLIFAVQEYEENFLFVVVIVLVVVVVEYIFD